MAPPPRNQWCGMKRKTENIQSYEENYRINENNTQLQKLLVKYQCIRHAFNGNICKFKTSVKRELYLSLNKYKVNAIYWHSMFLDHKWAHMSYMNLCPLKSSMKIYTPDRLHKSFSCSKTKNKTEQTYKKRFFECKVIRNSRMESADRVVWRHGH